jgi:hypothetical protein
VAAERERHLAAQMAELAEVAEAVVQLRVAELELQDRETMAQAETEIITAAAAAELELLRVAATALPVSRVR